MKQQPISEVGTIELTPTLWTHSSEIGNVRPLGDEDYNTLKEIRDVLQRHDAVDRFGIHLISNDIETAENELFIEETDVLNRLQVSGICNVTDVSKDVTMIETQWVFNRQKKAYCRAACVLENRDGKRIHEWQHFLLHD